MKKLTIRLSDELSERVAKLARKSQRSVNRQVVWLIEEAVWDHIAHEIAHSEHKGSTAEPTEPH